MPLFRQKKSSKKYADLIERASSKWANWDPAKKIKVGSYGYINRKTGAFVVEGQIDDLKSSDGKTRFPYSAEDTKTVNILKISSTDGTCVDVDVGINAGVGGNPLAALQWGFGFKKTRGAFLLMVDHRMKFLPDSVKHAILNANDEKLKKLQVVTGVSECKAYCLYLSNKCGETVKVGLVASAPVPGAPAVTVGGLMNARWAHEGAQTMFQASVTETGDFDFTPLFEVEEICSPERRRDDGPVDEGADRWGKVSAPWGTLDSDGEEEIYFSDEEEEEEDDDDDDDEDREDAQDDEEP